MASVLLQSRGAGLGATFGGDSSVYRSRRGIEKRLFQFTVVLAVLFVDLLDRLPSSCSAERARPSRRSASGSRARIGASPETSETAG